MFSQNQKYFLILLLIAILIGTIISYIKPLNNNKPEKNVLIENNANQTDIKPSYVLIHLSGEVKNPGVYKIKENSRLVDLLKIAGGVTKKADIDIINLVQLLSDGQKISIPKKDLAIISNTIKKIPSNQSIKININFATLDSLKIFPELVIN